MNDTDQEQHKEYLKSEAQEIMARVKGLWMTIGIIMLGILICAGYFAFGAVGGLGIILVLALAILALAAIGWFLVNLF